MANLISKSVTSLAAFALGAVMTVTAAEAQQETRTVTGERYAPTIWVDPDGCEHWVMDDGFEGYMSPHTTRQGIPVCHRGNVCGVMNSDQFFATNSHRISASGAARLQEFFRSAQATSFIIAGHTDDVGNDNNNKRLSMARAATVRNALIAEGLDAKRFQAIGLGETMPLVKNDSAEHRAKNRRVEFLLSISEAN